MSPILALRNAADAVDAARASQFLAEVTAVSTSLDAEGQLPTRNRDG